MTGDCSTPALGHFCLSAGREVIPFVFWAAGRCSPESCPGPDPFLLFCFSQQGWAAIPKNYTTVGDTAERKGTMGVATLEESLATTSQETTVRVSAGNWKRKARFQRAVVPEKGWTGPQRTLSTSPCLCGTRDSTPNTELHPSPYLFILWQGLTLNLRCPGWAGTCSPPTSASQGAGRAGMRQRAECHRLSDTPDGDQGQGSQWTQVGPFLQAVVTPGCQGGAQQAQGKGLQHHCTRGRRV